MLGPAAAAVVAIFVTTISPVTSYASSQDCYGYDSWSRGGSYWQMSISSYSTTAGVCKLAISPASTTTYTPGQQFTVTISSTSSLGYKVVGIGGATISSPTNGGYAETSSCIDWDGRSTSATFKVVAPKQQGAEIRVRAICGRYGDAMYVADDIVLQPDVPTAAPSLRSGTSTDPAYLYMTTLTTDSILYYQINNTHLNIKLQVNRNAWISLGVGTVMVPSIAIIAMDPASNTGYQPVAMYNLTSKTGTNNQVAAVLSSDANDLSLTYGIMQPTFVSTGATSTLTFSVLLSRISSKFQIINPPINQTDIMFAIGSSATFGMHSVAGTVRKMNWQTGSSSGATLVLGTENPTASPISTVTSGYQVSLGLAGHIGLMIVAWLILCPFGVMVPLFGKNGYLFTGWYKKHWMIQTCGVFIGYIATYLGYNHVDDEGVPHWNTDHKMIGLAILVMSIAQPLLGYFRPDRSIDSTLRRGFEWLHWSMGYTLIFLGVVAALLGVGELQTTSGLRNGDAYTFLTIGDVLGYFGNLGMTVVLLSSLVLLCVVGGGFLIQCLGPRYERETFDVLGKVSDTLPRYSRAQVASHAKDMWIIYKGLVYDASRFAGQHPGGRQRIMSIAGKDMTYQFEDAGHSPAALGELTRMLIGRLLDQDLVGDHRSSSRAATNKYSRGVIIIPTDESSSLVKSQGFLSRMASSEERKLVELTDKVALSNNVWQLTFAFPHDHTHLSLGLPVGKHIVMLAPAPGAGKVPGQWNGRPDNEAWFREIQRRYTPISSNDDVGGFTLVVKAYRPTQKFVDGGKMGTYFDKLILGDKVQIGTKPVGAHEYVGQGKFVGDDGQLIQASTVVMLAGGTGITPMYQMATALLKEPPTVIKHITLIFANSTPEDVFLRTELEELQKKYDGRFVVWFTVSRAPPTGWRGLTGRVSKEMFMKLFPAINHEFLAIACGPILMMETVGGILRSMGLDRRQVMFL